MTWIVLSTLLTFVVTAAFLHFYHSRAREQLIRERDSLVKRLERSNESRLKIIEELSHDLRTPLTSILNIFESISDEKDLSPKFLRECSAVVLPEIAYINALIRDLFLIAKMAEGTYSARLVPFDLAGLISEEVRHGSSIQEAMGRNVRLEFSISGEFPPLVTGDQQLLQRFVRNLLGNSTRFARSKVTVTLETITNAEWRLSITDDGTGFDSGSVDSFFTNQRPDLTNKTADSSSLGLGSVIVRRIMQIHGGEVRIFNRLNEKGGTKGALLQFTFPLSLPATAKKAA